MNVCWLGFLGQTREVRAQKQGRKDSLFVQIVFQVLIAAR